MGIGQTALFSALALGGMVAGTQLLADPDCRVDGDAGVHLSDGGFAGHLGENGLSLSEDGSYVFQGISNPQPFCRVATEDFGDAQQVVYVQDDPDRVAIRNPDGSLEVLERSTGYYDLTIGELTDSGDTAIYSTQDVDGNTQYFSLIVEPATDWKPLSELPQARTPAVALGANDI